jgi:hypothetical protein
MALCEAVCPCVRNMLYGKQLLKEVHREDALLRTYVSEWYQVLLEEKTRMMTNNLVIW